MLEHLYIRNVALIEETEIDFKSGLNILSGETGAGKSIVIDAINFVLGEKPSRDFIHTGAESATVEAVISIKGLATIDEIILKGIDIDDDKLLLISRTVNRNSKTICRANGKVITISMLKEISSMLVDIHAQHQHQSLLTPSKHINLLDKFCGEKLNEYKLLLVESYKKYKKIKNNIIQTTANEKDREARIDILQYQIKEIKDARLKQNEEKLLLEQRAILSNCEKLKNHVNSALELLYRDDMSAIDKISSAANNIYNISIIDSSQNKLHDRMESILAELEDIVQNIRHYNDSIEYNPDLLNQIEMRIDIIHELKRKYGSTTDEIIEFCNDAQRKLDIIINSEEEFKRLNIAKKQVEKEIIDICNKITQLRKSASESIQTQIEFILNELGMKNAKFKIDITKKDIFDISGIDKVEFLISANVGEDLKPLAKIASGGEMSRIMLALKVVLANADNIETFIFDEIDTGVSGRTAQQVAQKLAILGKTHQIICITHLPQIASMADVHFLIEKSFSHQKTVSNVYKLDYNGTINEIARLTGGAQITMATVKAAEEMKIMADKLK